jgi:hypothetical protein
VRLTDLNGDPVRDVFGNVVPDQVTSSLGEYRFDGLPLGEYRVVVVTPPSGTRATLAHGTVLEVLLDTPGQHLSDVDFAFVPLPPVQRFIEAFNELFPIPRLIPAGLDPSRDVPLALGALLALVLGGVAWRRRQRRRRAMLGDVVGAGSAAGSVAASVVTASPSVPVIPGMRRPDTLPPLFDGKGVDAQAGPAGAPIGTVEPAATVESEPPPLPFTTPPASRGVVSRPSREAASRPSRPRPPLALAWLVTGGAALLLVAGWLRRREPR